MESLPKHSRTPALPLDFQWLPDIERMRETWFLLSPAYLDEAMKQDYAEYAEFWDWYFGGNQSGSPAPERRRRTQQDFGPPADIKAFTHYRSYQADLRQRVAPIIRDLMGEGLIDWFSFLVHDYSSGIDTSPDDKRHYLHLRIALAEGVTPAQAQARLPADWAALRPLPPQDPDRMDSCLASTMTDGDLRWSWWLLGLMCAGALGLTVAHPAGRFIPIRNIFGHLHYFGNAHHAWDMKLQVD